MLYDLLLEVCKHSPYNFTVFCGSTAYQDDLGKRKTNNFILPNLSITRISTLRFGRKSILTRLLDYSVFYLFVFFYFLFSRKWDAIVSLTSPPLVSSAAALSLVLNSKPFICYIQDLYPELLYDLGYVKLPLIIRKMRIFNKITFSRSVKIITLGEYMTEKILKNYMINKKKIIEINNWAKGIIYKNKLSGKPFTILYSGNMGFAHDFGLFGIIIDYLKQENSIRYIFAGNGKRKKELISVFKERMENRIAFKDYIDREGLSDVLSEGDIFLLAQSEKTVGDLFPSKIYSYLAAGRPILYLGSKRSEIAKIILKNDIGFVCESETDIKGAISFIKICMDYPDVADGIGQKARNLYEKYYTVSVSAQKFSTLLDEICQ